MGQSYFFNTKWLIHSVKQNLRDQFIQNWNEIVQNSPKTLNYRLYKDDVKLEDYFKLLDDKMIIDLCKFRTVNHRLPIEGRWLNIARNSRTCNLCRQDDIGDEYHYILVCPFFVESRKKFIPSYYCKRPNVIKFRDLMTTKNRPKLIKLVKFINIINKTVATPG